ncbi:hypothetical protein NXC24_PA00124 (plasmid) [Rhizobium sp. NXC24]|nr:hypothetical protein NXC24_PA00124 [Rhizobium sp. NXC24]
MTSHNSKIEVLSGPERRRRLSTAEKFAIVRRRMRRTRRSASLHSVMVSNRTTSIAFDYYHLILIILSAELIGLH